jgi:hypothetical protein
MLPNRGQRKHGEQLRAMDFNCFSIEHHPIKIDGHLTCGTKGQTYHRTNRIQSYHDQSTMSTRVIYVTPKSL